MVLLPIDANCHCPFPTWFSLSFYRVLWNAVLEVRSRGILEGFLLQACNQCSLQQALVKTLKLKNVTPYCPILRLEDKFDRWRLSERGDIACRRALRCLQHISKHSRPAVVITVLILRVWFNGWPTARRMRNMPSNQATQRCNLGCQLCEDSIEHYSCCSAAVFFGNFAAPPFPMVWELLPGTDQRKTFSW